MFAYNPWLSQIAPINGRIPSFSVLTYRLVLVKRGLRIQQLSSNHCKFHTILIFLYIFKYAFQYIASHLPVSGGSSATKIAIWYYLHWHHGLPRSSTWIIVVVTYHTISHDSWCNVSVLWVEEILYATIFRS